jgi:molybdopterin synthase catalytic subunit
MAASVREALFARGAARAALYPCGVLAPPQDATWVGLTDGPLSVGAVADWAVLPSCGAVVTFTGTARDHSEGRPGVRALAYEAYEEQIEPRFTALADEARRRWPDLGRLALLHRVGPVAIGEASVVVAASAPHRDHAFEAARWCIDSLKATAPIWKRETWEGGESWGLDARDLTELTTTTTEH